jgi:fermentation-respiration switch protein FrsA (DUF1100 family)
VEQSSGYAQLAEDIHSIGQKPVETFSLQSAEAYYDVRPESEVGQIRPRPLLIVHGSANPYLPIDEAHRLHARAGEPKAPPAPVINDTLPSRRMPGSFCGGGPDRLPQSRKTSRVP